MSVYIDFNVDAMEIICVSIQTSIHRLHLNTIVITQEFLFLDLSHKQLRQDTTIEAAND